MADTRELRLRGEYITLEALLKAAGATAGGADAKALIAAGEVAVNGEAERRRGRKLRAGDVVAAAGVQVRVLGA
jgi:ribosome-associated protein